MSSLRCWLQLVGLLVVLGQVWAGAWPATPADAARDEAGQWQEATPLVSAPEGWRTPEDVVLLPARGVTVRPPTVLFGRVPRLAATTTAPRPSLRAGIVALRL